MPETQLRIGAVDIGGTRIRAACVTPSGEVLSAAECLTQAAKERHPLEAIKELLARCGGRFDGIGIGCTGPVDPVTGTVGCVDLLPGWEGIALTESLSAAYGVPAALENDADAAALGEHQWGAGRGASRFLYVTISTGIGAGLVLEGNLYRGASGSHPELGHMTIDGSGPECYCGAKGCWESLASGPAMVRGLSRVTARELCEEARAGDAAALRIVEREAEYLGIGLANLVTMLVPDVIALGGGVMQSADLFLPRIREIVRNRCGLVPAEKTRMLRAELGESAGILGAARVWLARYLGTENRASVTGI